MKKTLVIGYGNQDRQDDGVAWHVLNGIAAEYEINVHDLDNPESIHVNETLDLLYLLQLVPELSERISQYQKVCFVDAHTGDIPDLIKLEEIKPKYHQSPFTHHMTPQTLLEICKAIYGDAPQALLASIRGYEFGFIDRLSDPTSNLVPEAIQKINRWVNE